MGGHRKKRGGKTVDLALKQKRKDMLPTKIKASASLMPAARRVVRSGDAPLALAQKQLLRTQERALTLPQDHPERIAAAAAARERLISAGILDTDGNLTEFYRE